MIQKLTVEEYNALDAVNVSLLCLLNDTSEAHVLAHLQGRKVEKSSQALQLGNLFHKWLLEPEKVAGSFHIKPQGIKLNTIEGKIWKFIHSEADPSVVELQAGLSDLFRNCQEANFNEACMDELATFWKKISKQHKTLIEAAKPARPFVDEQDISDTRGMVESVLADPGITQYITGAQPEVTLTATDRAGVKRKGRLDLFKRTDTVIVDFKRAISADPEDFVKAAYDHGYFIRGAFYIDLCRLLGINKDRVVFVAVEPHPPYVVQPYEYRDEPGSFIRLGRTKYRALLQRLVNAKQNNHWPRYVEGFADPENFAAPWLLKELEQV